MAAYHFTPDTERPILFAYFGPGFNIAQHLAPANAELASHLDAAAEPLFYVLDTRPIKLSFVDVIKTVSILTEGDQAIFRHPRLREVVVVAASVPVELGTLALNQRLFGQLKTQVFKTVEEAYAYVESHF